MTRLKRKSKLKRILIVIALVIASFFLYVEIVNRNSTNMTYRQKVLKAVYPLFMWWGKIRSKNSKELTGTKQPAESFYNLHATLNNGQVFDFNSLKGKKVLIVNTASNCGYTNQYSDLQELSEKFRNKLVIIGFPANDFKEQEKGTDEEIAQFCKVNFGVTFPLMKKSSVVKSTIQDPVFKWLTDSSKNGWNSKQPEWNFSKYLVDENGILKNYFGATISPLSNDVVEAINK